MLVIGLFALAAWVRETRDWPTARSDNVLLVGVLVIGLIPLGLVLIDALIRRGGALTFQGFTIDLAAASRPAVAFSINTNVGVTGETLADTSSEEILDVLERAAASEIVVVDLKDGQAWWETRLLILAAGAVRTGRPRALVFVAARAGQSQSFLGWVTPKSLLDALLDPRNPRHVVYLKSYGLALEAGVQWQQEIDKLRTSFPAAAPATPPGLTTYPWNALWIAWREGKPNPFAPEQFLAAALGREIEETWRAVPWPGADASPTEQFPRAVTITEETVRTQFGPQLHRTSMDASAASDTQQVEAFLEDSSDFAAITREGELRGTSRSALRARSGRPRRQGVALAAAAQAAPTPRRARGASPPRAGSCALWAIGTTQAETKVARTPSTSRLAAMNDVQPGSSSSSRAKQRGPP